MGVQWKDKGTSKLCLLTRSFLGVLSQKGTDRTTMKDTCHLKLFGRHVQKKQKGVNFNNMFCSTKYIPNIILSRYS